VLPKPQTSSRLLTSATDRGKFIKRELTKKETINQIFVLQNVFSLSFLTGLTPREGSLLLTQDRSTIQL